MSVTWRQRLAPVVAIDLGTSRTRIWSSQLDEVIDEASCLAVEQPSSRVVAIGDDAAEMVGRVASKIEVIWPVQHAEIADLQYAQAFLRGLWQRALPQFAAIQPVVMLAVPHSLSAAKRQFTVELFYKLGARDVFTISQPLAAAIGAGVPIADASGSLMVSMGAGLVEAAVISLGSVVQASVSRQAGQYWDEALQLQLQQHAGLQVSRQEVEKLKQQVVSFGPTKKMLVSGQDVEHVAPKEVWVTTDDLQPVLDRIMTTYRGVIEQMLSKIPPELTVDVIDKGILLSGGLSQLHDLDRMLTDELGVAVTTIDTASDLTFKGTQTALTHLHDFKQSLGYLVTK